MTEDRSCKLCGEPGMKRRVQVLPWKMECIFICKACMPQLAEAIQQVRAELLK